MSKLKILSLNCFGSPLSVNRKIRFVQIAKSIILLTPDVVVLQEVIFSTDRKILQDLLARESYMFFPKENINFKNGGLLVFVKNVEAESFKFKKFNQQGPISLLSVTDRFLGKGVQLLEINIGSKSIDLINTHFLCKYGNNKKVSDAFLMQMDEFLEFIKKNCSHPLVVCGDINVNPISNEILVLKKQLSLIDNLPESAHTVFLTNTNRGKLMNKFGDGNPFRTDFILLGKGITNLKQEVVFNDLKTLNNKKFNLSDHFGVYAELKI